jgi:hypothetical protein
VKLMAGDVNKIKPEDREQFSMNALGAAVLASEARGISEKSFEDLHLYTIERPTTVRDRETKQIELVRGTGVGAPRRYVYDGAAIDWNQWRNQKRTYVRSVPEFGSEGQPKVWVMREIANTAANHLGMPLPKGRVRFYRRDTDGRLEFTGENMIDHTPKDETLRVYTGNAFDLVGERTRTKFLGDSKNSWFDETFEIELRNHKQEAVEVRVVEHLYRWTNWTISATTQEWTKKNAQTIEYKVTVPADGTAKVSYTVHYSW